MSRSVSIISAFFLLFALLAACTPTVHVSSDYDTGEDFSTLHNYRWVGGEDRAGGPPLPPFLEMAGGERSLIKSRVTEAINRELKQKGYQFAGIGGADFLVEYHLVSRPGFNINTFDTGFGFLDRSSTSRVNEYQVGTLIIDIIDARKRKLVWRATGQSRLDSSLNAEQRTEQINAAVSKMLQSFPP